jgi:lipoprotein-anchoring transpeptidase ErfK/SrfK
MIGKHHVLAAMALAFATPALPAFAADNSAQAIQVAESAVRQARQDMRAVFGNTTLRPGQFKWRDGHASSEVNRIVLDLSRQMAFAYGDAGLIAISTISSGDKNHLSPVGVYPIMEKKRMHRSIRYDNAPMPFMQRINDGGVALHAGALPGYPASHGCIRLPHAFAAKLFGVTDVGTTVLLAEPEGPPSRNVQVAARGAG